MRGIKFRAWSVCGKYLDKVGEMTWTVGGLRAAGTGVYFCGCKERWSEKDLVGEHIILEQFTGLRDRNGVEIYEGDIVRGLILFDDEQGGEYKDNEITISAVEVDLDKYEGYKFHAGMLNLNDVVVIGNVHENPELLNV